MQDMLPRLEPPSASEADVFAALVGGGGAVLAAPEFEQLLAEKNQMLLLFGPPGSGESVLSSLLGDTFSRFSKPIPALVSRIYIVAAIERTKSWISSSAVFCRMWEHSAEERKRVDCFMECTSKLIYMRDTNVHVSV
jgi:hypothetical protein